MRTKFIAFIFAAALSTGNAAADHTYPWLEKTASFLSENHLKPRRSVTVAIIDTGIDTTHSAISSRLWTNRGEIPGDGIDNDGNGYVDDVHGWNFLGNAEGSDIESSGTAEYREYKRLKPVYENADTSRLSPEQMEEYRHWVKMYMDANIGSFVRYEQNLRDQISRLEASGDGQTNGYLEYFRERLADVSAKVAQLDTDDDVHRKAGNDPDDFSDLHYGNNHITVNPEHGTMVAGLIALSAQQCGVDVEIMPLRAVPDRGDEYDRDIAASIRYAVDNGADVINMSLGKYFSLHEDQVSAAIEYAASHEVLIVMAAGNNGSDNDLTPVYPSPYSPEGRRHTNLLVIGACTCNGEIAEISNFGQKNMDILAPGVDVETPVPDNSYDCATGTSISSPVVAAAAAVMLAYNPGLGASGAIQIIRGTSEGRILDACSAIKSAIGPFVDWEKVNSFCADSLYRLARNSYSSIRWSSAGGVDVAHWETENEDGELEYRYFIPKYGREPKLMFDTGELTALLASVDSAVAAAVEPGRLRIYPDFETTDIISFRWAGKNLEYSISKKTVRVSDRRSETPYRAYGGAEWWKKWCADSSFYVYSKNHNIYVYGKNGIDVQLSTDGELYNSFSVSGALPDKNVENPGYANGSWIAGTHSYFVLREDTRKVGSLSILNNIAQPRPEVTTYKYAMAGDKEVPQYECFVINADSCSMKRVDTDKWKDQKLLIPKYSGVRTTSNAAWVLRINRQLDSLELCRIDAGTAELKVVIAEECKPHYNEVLFDYHLINDGKEILWWSEREGKGAWYLYSGDGTLRNKISGGDFVAGQIKQIDTAGRQIIFAGYGYRKDVNPEYDFYFRAGLNGRRTVCLTPENGEHTISVSGSGKYISDTFSRMDAAPKTRIYDMNGRELAFVSDTDMSEVYASGWEKPELVKVKAADGVTDLWGIVYFPKDMEPGRKYPIISHVYPGPQTDLMPKSFCFDDDGNHSMAQMGCIVINFMHRGSNPWMGRDFYTFGYGNMRDYPIADDKAIIEQLAQMYDCIDLDRVGIFGHSGGGFMSATALMTYPDFYKVAVAASGNYDNNIYSILWGEVYHGVHLDEDGIFKSEIPVTQDLAANLKGKILLITGDVDRNVHPASTIRMTDALIRAGKRFDMLVIPGAGHDIGGDYYDNAIRYYFLNNLLGVRTYDTDIINHR